PEEWARIALAELKMRHTLCGGQYAERRYVTKLHQPLFRTAVTVYENTEVEGMDTQHYNRQMVCHPPGCNRNADSCVTASGLDLASMANCFLRSRHELKALVMVILGTDQSVDGLWVSLHNHRGCRQLRLLKETLSSATVR
ncbi:MAG: hypothetical protein WAK51_06150, partial [Opitutaceae bacterium]